MVMNERSPSKPQQNRFVGLPSCLPGQSADTHVSELMSQIPSPSTLAGHSNVGGVGTVTVGVAAVSEGVGVLNGVSVGVNGESVGVKGESVGVNGVSVGVKGVSVGTSASC